MPATYVGANNTFVPNHEASGKMVVDFSRNPNKFALNRYAQIVPVNQPIGYYLEMTVEEAGRILNTDGRDFAWPDGNDAPTGTNGTESHEFKQFRLERYAPTARLGYMAIQHASWDVVAQHSRIKAQQAMTLRTQLAATVATTSGNYAATHTSAVSSISGNAGNWAQSTTARADIKRSLNYAFEIIQKDTLSAVEDPNDCVLVISPATARAISESQEVIDYLKHTETAKRVLEGEVWKNEGYGVPDRLYGFEVCVEKTVKVTSKKKASSTSRSFVWPAGSAALMSRPGGLVGVANAPSFSTLTIFVHEEFEMAVETWDDVNNKRSLVRVVDMIDPVLTAPVSGFLFTSTGGV